MFETMLALLALLIAGGLGAWIVARLYSRSRRSDPGEIAVSSIAERVRQMGKLVGLEVHAKEIATARRGVGWLPPLVLSDAKLAMIFRFEKQYHIDLAAIDPEDVDEYTPGHCRIKMPQIEGTLRLIDVQPYDIQQGRVLGLFDVIQMNADRQGALMNEAQHQAADLFERSDDRYLAQAIDSIERQLGGLLERFGIQAEFVWPRKHAADPEQVELVLDAVA